MNTTTVTRRTGWARRALLGVLATVAALTTTIAATPAPAQAAPYGTVTGCFQAAYTTNSGTYWGQMSFADVRIEAHYGGDWTTIGWTRTGSNGCVTAAVPLGYYWRLKMDYYRSPTKVIGASKYVWVGQALNYNLGLTRASSFTVG